MTYGFGIEEKGLGYEPKQVDEFISNARKQFEDASQNLVTSGLARRSTFALIKGGYSVAAVDSAIDRLEDTFALKEIAKDRAEQGDFAIENKLARFIDSLESRIDRPKSKRFKKASWPLRGYSTKQVDSFVGQIERFLFSGAQLTTTDVRNELFKAKRGGYSEAQVDAFLERTIEVIHLKAALNK